MIHPLSINSVNFLLAYDDMDDWVNKFGNVTSYFDPLAANLAWLVEKIMSEPPAMRKKKDVLAASLSFSWQPQCSSTRLW